MKGKLKLMIIARYVYMIFASSLSTLLLLLLVLLMLGNGLDALGWYCVVAVIIMIQSCLYTIRLFFSYVILTTERMCADHQ